jgi:hypothetical protein
MYYTIADFTPPPPRPGPIISYCHVGKKAKRRTEKIGKCARKWAKEKKYTKK